MEYKRRRGLVRFGSLQNPDGALLVIQTREDQKDALAYVLRESLRIKGVRITAETEFLIQRDCERYVRRMEASLRERGVPPSFQELFSARRRRESREIARRIEVSSDDLRDLLFNCEQLGYRRVSQHKDVIPSHLRLTRADLERMQRGPSGKNPIILTDARDIRRVDAIQRERRMLHMHLLERSEEWQLLCYTTKDMLARPSGEANHWTHGAHVHYESFLCGRPKGELLAALEEPRPRLPRIHIRYHDSDDPV